jgi:hypothetical protein
MPEAGFEPTITASKQPMTVHTLDRSSTGTGSGITLPSLIFKDVVSDFAV